VERVSHSGSFQLDLNSYICTKNPKFSSVPQLNGEKEEGGNGKEARGVSKVRAITEGAGLMVNESDS